MESLKVDVGSLLSRVVGALLNFTMLLVVSGLIDESIGFSTRFTIIGSFPLTLKNSSFLLRFNSQKRQKAKRCDVKRADGAKRCDLFYLSDERDGGSSLIAKSGD